MVEQFLTQWRFEVFIDFIVGKGTGGPALIRTLEVVVRVEVEPVASRAVGAEGVRRIGINAVGITGKAIDRRRSCADIGGATETAVRRGR